VHWPIDFRGRRECVRPESNATAAFDSAAKRRRFAALAGSSASVWIVLLVLLASAFPPVSRAKDKLSYGEGLIINIPIPESEVSQVVAEIAQNGMIRGTKEYNKDEFVAGAKSASSSHVFPAWEQGGKIFYKVREEALDPRNFKDSGDVGTLAVRYVVQPQGEKNTVLRIDALFQEDFRRTVHPSNGSVESAEYKDIEEHLEAIEVMKKQNVEAEKERQEQLLKKRDFVMPADSRAATPVQSPPEEEVTAGASHGAGEPQGDTAHTAQTAQTAVEVQPVQSMPAQTLPGQSPPGQSLEDHVKDLRKQVGRFVKAPGAALKSAPFHTASTLQSLTAGTEVLIVISTPYWYGVETHEGQHGWIMRDQLEQR
jgi:hypothetical protein